MAHERIDGVDRSHCRGMERMPWHGLSPEGTMCRSYRNAKKWIGEHQNSLLLAGIAGAVGLYAWTRHKPKDDDELSNTEEAAASDVDPAALCAICRSSLSAAA